MAINPVTPAEATAAVSAQRSVTRSPQAGPQSAPAAKEKETSESLHKATTGTVQISNARKAALQEATETAAQTAREASSGDHLAQRMIEKAAALRIGQK